jgi:hypothetical protein
MGVFKMFSGSSYDREKRSRSLIHFSGSKIAENKVSEKIAVLKDKTLPNPRPDNYKILHHEAVKNFLIIEIQYLDCTNYEGRKILLFENCTITDLEKQKLIDPHFSESKKFFSPIARFEPTERGWNCAIIFSRLFAIEMADKQVDISETKLVDYNLSVRVLNVLRVAGIKTVRNLVEYNLFDLLAFRNFGKASLKEVKEFIEGLEKKSPLNKMYNK